MGLGDEHVQEEDAEEGAALFASELEDAQREGGEVEGEVEDRLQDEGGHQLVEEVTRLVHLVAAADDRGQDFEDLFGYKVIFGVLF